ncbi:MAG TPA: hypothetical protein VHA37_09895 [Candidatus Saccharimonadales bacterium]|nr:hypothetical protein [Candidatus Saccharimonadales bacterium]
MEGMAGETNKGNEGQDAEAARLIERQWQHATEAAGPAAVAGAAGAETFEEDTGVGSLDYYRENYAAMDWTPEEL